MRHLILLICTLSLFGCSDDKRESKGNGAQNSGPQGMLVVNEAALPACNAGNENFLVYVQATAAFKVCQGGQWVDVAVKGEKGDTGAQGESGESDQNFKAAIALFQTYQTSIYKLRLICDLDGAVMTTDSGGGSVRCDDASLGNPAQRAFSGSGFLCADKSVCTNAHVVSCQSTCYPTFNSVSIQAIEGESTSINPDSSQDSGATPFFTTTNNNQDIKLHANGDLAKVFLESKPKGEIMPLSDKPSTTGLKPLTPILSMSFPLGFQDLHVDVGEVIVSHLTHCTGNSPTVDKYFCPAIYYDFTTSNDTDHGSSGSPLLDINSGKVVGVTSAGTQKENANYTWAIDASRLLEID